MRKQTPRLVMVAVLTVAAGLQAQTQPAGTQQQLRELEADLDALAAKREVARVADLIKPPVPDAENAVFELRAAAKSIDTTSEAQEAYDRMDPMPRTPLSQEQVVVLTTLVMENEKALSLIKAAALKTRVDWQTKYATPMISVLLPDLSQQRQLANLLRPAAQLAHHEGDDARALEHVRQLLFVGRCVGQQPFFVSHLVRTGIDAMACNAAQEIAPSLQLGQGEAGSQAVASTIRELLDEADARAGLQRAMAGERLAQTDTAVAILSGKLKFSDLVAMGHPGGDAPHLTLPQDAGILLEDTRIMIQVMSRNIDAAGASDWPSAREKMKPFPPPQRLEPQKHAFLSVMLPSLERGIEAHFLALAQRRMAAAAMAMRWYSLEHQDKLPAKLADLVPRYLPEVPRDPMASDRPLGYVPDRGLIYSVGRDGRDDGGRSSPRGADLVVPLR